MTEHLGPIAQPGLDLEIVQFCAVECELQRSGERSVGWMAEAWLYAQVMAPVPPTVSDVIRLGQLVEPVKNARGFRECGVRIGYDVKDNWRLVPTQMVNLCKAVEKLTAAEFFYEYEDVHPFVDGQTVAVCRCAPPPADVVPIRGFMCKRGQ